MQELSVVEYKIITQKWAFFILIALRRNKKYSYKKIAQKSEIPTSTLDIRLAELVKYKFIEKFVYGSIRGPHNVDYKISNFGLKYLNDLLPDGVL